MKKSRKLINFRLPVTLLILVILTCLSVAYMKIYALFINVFILLFAIGYTIYLLHKREKLLKFILFITVSLLVVNGCIVQYILQCNRYNTEVNLLEPVSVQGKVVEIASHSEFSKTLLVKTEKMINVNHLPLKNAYLKLFVSGSSDIRIGNTIRFTTTLEKYKFSNHSENITNFIENIQYSGKINATKVDILPSSTFNLFIYLRAKVYQVLFDNFDSEVASFAYAMLIGDNSFLEDDSLQNIRYAGIAHIFAISGLHIGILHSLLNALFKKLPLPKLLKLICIGSILFFYSGVCRFSASTLRATIMALLSLFSRYTFRKRDAFNTLSLAGLAILLIQPMQLFNIGFQLSMVAVFALTVIAPHFVRLCKVKRGYLKRVLQAVILPSTVQLATFPFLINYFGYASWIALLANILVIPILSGIFILLFLSTLLSLFFTPFATVLLYLPMKLLGFIIQPLTLFSFKIFLLSGFAFGVGSTLAWLLALFILSDKVNLSWKAKAVAVTSCFAIIALLFILQTCIPNEYRQIILAQFYDSQVLLLKDTNKNYLLTDSNLSNNFLNNFFIRQNVKEIEGLYLFSEDVKYINSIVPVIHRLAPVKNVYTLTDDLENAFHPLQMHTMNQDFTVASLSGKRIGTGAIQLYDDTISILVLYRFEEIVYPSVDILIAKSYRQELIYLTSPEYAFYFSAEENIEGNLLSNIDTVKLLLPKRKRYAIYNVERKFEK